MSIFQPHEVRWDEEKLAHFWDFFSGQGRVFDDWYFSRAYGDAIISYVKKRVPICGEVLDFGCGPGHLMEHLINKGIACSGLDFSGSSVTEVKKKFGNNPLFHGALAVKSLPSALPDASQDIIFFIETIEHLLPEHLESTLKEFFRLLKPGGIIVITTPHDENLNAKKVICPDCGAIFHRVEHLRSYTVPSLKELFGHHGFSAISAEATTFRAPSWFNLIRKLRDARKQTKQPHLIYIGEKK